MFSERCVGRRRDRSILIHTCWTLSCSFLAAMPLVFRTASVAASPAHDLELICGKDGPRETLVEYVQPKAGLPQTRPPPTPGARYLLNETGDLEVAKADGFRFCLSRGNVDCNASAAPDTRELVVRIDRVAPRGKRRVACQRISPGILYEFGPVDGRPMRGPEGEVRKGDVLTVSSYAALGAAHQAAEKKRKEKLSGSIAETEAKVIRHQVLKALVAKPAASIVASDVAAAEAKLATAKVDWSCPPPPLPPEAYPGSDKLCELLDETSLALRELKAKLAADVTTALKPLVEQGAPPGPIPESHCEQVAKHRWLSDPTRSRLLTRHAVSDVPKDELLDVSYDLGTSDVMMNVGKRPVLLVSGVPSEQPLRFTAKSGDLLLKDPGTLIAGFLEHVLPLAAKALKVDSGAVPKAKTFEPLCSDDEQRLDEELPPLAPVGSRVFAPREELRERELKLSVCAGTECKLEGDEKNLTNTVAIAPQNSVAPVVMLGVGTTMRFNQFGKLRPQSNAPGPDQVFEFRDGNDIGILPTLDALIGLRIQNGLFALGPALAARDIPAFKHWKFLVGGRVPSLSRFLYLAAHFAVTLESQLQGVQEGDRFVVPIGANGSAAPPPLQAETRARFGVGITLGLDLAATADAGGKLISAIGGDSE